ncbi:MAG: hypothetical protein ABDI07_09630, partial [Candidatus Kryptonium sp.]
MKKALLIASFLLFVLNLIQSQTIPPAQSLPYSQDFSTLPHSSSTYPAGWQGWTIGTNPSDPTYFSALGDSIAKGNLTLISNSDASMTTGGVHNYNGKIGFLPVLDLNPSICLAINTTGFRRVIITYDIMTIRNPYDGSSNTRINKAALQYRAANNIGPFTTTADSNYQNNTTNKTSSGDTSRQNQVTNMLLLPSACENQSVVQLRWVARQVSGTGARPSFAIDNVYINGTRFFTSSGSLSGGPFYGLELDGDGITVSLNTNIVVDTLNFLQNGKVITGNYNLKVNKIVTGAGTGKFVEGNLVYPISSTGSKKWETGQGN